jgi:hypothetical protein
MRQPSRNRVDEHSQIARHAIAPTLRFLAGFVELAQSVLAWQTKAVYPELMRSGIVLCVENKRMKRIS